MQFIGVTGDRHSDHKSFHFHKMKSPMTKTRRGIVRRSRVTACMCHTHVWFDLAGISRECFPSCFGLWDIDQRISTFTGFQRSGRLPFLGNTDYIDPEYPASGIYSFYRFRISSSAWNRRKTSPDSLSASLVKAAQHEEQVWR